MKQAFHGGAFWEEIAPDFSSLTERGEVISADVLDAWFDPSPKVIEKLSNFLSFSIKTSPPTHSKGLISTIAKKRGIPESHILVGGGSSDLMFALFPNIMDRTSKVLILDPMYGEYSHIFEDVIGLQVLRHELKAENEFRVIDTELDAQIEAEKPDFVVLVNPNSPTGKHWPKESLLKLISSHPKITFVVDETYIEYVGSDASVETATVDHRNLIVIKSMSKMYALSGARVGYLVSHSDMIGVIAPFIPPWSVSLVGQIAAVEALRDEAYYKAKWSETHRLRTDLIHELKGPSMRVFDSVGNFFLVQLKNASAKHVIATLKANRICIRNCDSMSTQFHDDFIRIAIKDAASNSTIARALKTALES